MSKSKEPKILSQGKKFHKEVQSNWEQTADGHIFSERSIKAPNGKKGRVDIFVEVDGEYVAIAEIKNSAWDLMTPEALRRNVKRHIRQVWKYIDSQLSKGKVVTPGIIFPNRPKETEVMLLIEKMFEEEGITAVWEDESIQERKARS